MSKYINIHTHSSLDSDNIELLSLSFEEINQKEDQYPHKSYGIHPWWSLTPGELEEELLRIEVMCLANKIIAIGECGLDRKKYMPWSQQEKLFMKQIKLSEKYQKPMIIHAVKSYSDLVKLRKQSNSIQPWIIHGFNGSIQSMNQLINQSCYISFGASIFKEHAKTIICLKEIPLDKLFLESDNSGIDIIDIYRKAADIIGLDLNQLKEKLFDNYKRIF